MNIGISVFPSTHFNTLQNLVHCTNKANEIKPQYFVSGQHFNPKIGIESV